MIRTVNAGWADTEILRPKVRLREKEVVAAGLDDARYERANTGRGMPVWWDSLSYSSPSSRCMGVPLFAMSADERPLLGDDGRCVGAF